VVGVVEIKNTHTHEYIRQSDASELCLCLCEGEDGRTTLSYDFTMMMVARDTDADVDGWWIANEEEIFYLLSGGCTQAKKEILSGRVAVYDQKRCRASRRSRGRLW